VAAVRAAATDNGTGLISGDGLEAQREVDEPCKVGVLILWNKISFVECKKPLVTIQKQVASGGKSEQETVLPLLATKREA
jgi:hypothetical protein